MEKHAVLHGGGNNHRFGLFDMAMLKNNHIDAAGGIAAAVALLIRTGFLRRKPRLRLCVEARTAAEAVEATVTGADIVMLDNMSPVEIRATVRQMRAQARRLASPMPEVEISGGIRPEDLKALGRLPVQRISVGRLTHSAPAIDISMRIS
jgi:nicotinate-nucleotide pyrophosphorylase (carboxylating)